MSYLDQTYSFKNKERLTITKNADILLYKTLLFCESLYKISRQTGKPFWYWGSGNMTTYDYLFRF